MHTPSWHPPHDFRRDFHVSRAARDFYQFDEELFSVRGTMVVANFRSARLFAQQMNEKRDLVRFPEQAVKASQINAMAMIHEILHLMLVAYRQQRNPTVLTRALDYLNEQIDQAPVDETLQTFEGEFPAMPIYRGQITVEQFLAGETGNDPNRGIALEEMLLLWLTNINPAYSPYRELYDDSTLVEESEYRQIIDELKVFFAGEPGYGAGGENILDLLQAPMRASPNSLEGQLEYIRSHWTSYLGKYLFRLLASLDFIAEEQKIVFVGGGPGPSAAPDFSGLIAEPERFSPDLDWMPKTVMLAKNTYVWLDQLSKQYQREIRTLNQIPDEELDRLAQSGFTGLWLIGLWERSRASQRIKQMMGKPDAVASAYSLYDYQIAWDLGGYDAYSDLRDRAWQRGIRLASDMVPNHVGIDGKWVIEHPDWFVQLPYSPFPAYTFNGPNLCDTPGVGIYLEDHYYDKTDAAVVFQRRNFDTGEVRYIYHGNDGTSMAWNDTAQLNYLLPEVREAVIQTILHVARMFPIIRFDAAMTLAKKHYQRLWYPEPGSGGDIASRAEYGMTRPDFDAVFPEEFWRQVVDRVAAEVPDTLLLAEAFWLMEGYFVRTLGMHRVYNSAFMNMLKMEENAKYRSVIKNTVEFDPEILKRYVNFMNNPDEDTAVAQFGKEDKYFGVATLLSTMPGLPMFGHGQVEGFTEKYGMEFRRPMRDESPDPWLVARHQREIFPLLHKRYLFAEVANFRLYDFFLPDGSVHEDVFAYSNRAGDERGLVIYLNKWAEARGWIRTSAAYAVKEGEGKHLAQTSLADGLGLPNDPNAYVIFRDVASNLEYIRNCQQLHNEGMYIELGAFKYHVFLDFRVEQDNEWRQYGHLLDYLAGRGVPSIEDALTEIFLQPIHAPFKKLVDAAMFQRLIDAARADLAEVEVEIDIEVESGAEVSEEAIAEAVELAEAVLEAVADEAEEEVDELTALLDEVEAGYADLLSAIRDFTEGVGDPVALASQQRAELEAILGLVELGEEAPQLGALADLLITQVGNQQAAWATVFGWHFIHNLGLVAGEKSSADLSRSWIDEWLLGRILSHSIQGLGVAPATAEQAVGLVKLLTSNQRWFEFKTPQPAARLAFAVLSRLLRDSEVQQFIGVNRYQGVLWFNQEAYEQLCGWLALPAVVDSMVNLSDEQAAAQIEERLAVVHKLLAASEESGYQVEKLLDAVM
ncbi:MAG TPA: alpha-amylase family glycosyl hydrolase [Anaerolineae bacterium]|nr:alpha-amylase family glycosyl hydrolase [Anaerolineae bacterium]HNU03648.1 alpha-amylase family glycosyl hydrolase [Anaerolineae bacterium]